MSRIEFPDRNRNLDTYLDSIGISDFDEFIDKIAGQSRLNWDQRFSAQSINDYLREGHGNMKCGAGAG